LSRFISYNSKGAFIFDSSLKIIFSLAEQHFKPQLSFDPKSAENWLVLTLKNKEALLGGAAHLELITT